MSEPWAPDKLAINYTINCATCSSMSAHDATVVVFFFKKNLLNPDFPYTFTEI